MKDYVKLALQCAQREGDSKLLELANTDIESLAEAFGQLKRTMNTLKDSLDKIQYSIENYMEENHLEDIVANGFKISYKEVISNRFDTTLFKAEHPDTYKKYIAQTSSMRFNFR